MSDGVARHALPENLTEPDTRTSEPLRVKPRIVLKGHVHFTVFQHPVSCSGTAESGS